MSQLKQVKEHLLQGRSITPKEALKFYGSFRLASIIHRLRTEHGMDIITDDFMGYATYFLKKD